jgi:flagellar hook protein FlgE
MSLWGALNSGVSGLTAQSSAMGATSDNIANINTVGYKDTQTHFSTLVTKQVSLNSYSSGGVKAVSRANVNAQGLLTSTNYTTDLAISGDGFFVVNTSSQAGIDGSWAYTRQGDFYSDDAGNLKNTGGYISYGWSIMKYDSADANAASATLIEWNNELYVKAYTNANGTVTYVNDSIIDDRNLQPVNVETISGGLRQLKNSYGYEFTFKR